MKKKKIENMLNGKNMNDLMQFFLFNVISWIFHWNGNI